MCRMLTLAEMNAFVFLCQMISCKYTLKLKHNIYVHCIIMSLIIYLFSVNTFTPIERCAIIFVIAQAEKLLIGQKLQNCARCNSSLIGQ